MVKHKKNTGPIRSLKSIFAFGVFILFISQVFLLNIYFEVKRFQIKKEVKQKIFGGIPNDELTIITKDLSFDENEFMFNGKMYDVVRSKRIGDKQLLYCFEDSHETELANNIEEQIHNTLERHPSQKSKQKLIDFLKIKFIQNGVLILQKLFTTNGTATFYYKNVSYTTIIHVISPPPKDII